MNIPLIRALPDWSAKNFAREFDELSLDPLIIDAMLGTGASGKVRKPLDKAILAANRHRGTRVAIDVPTGINGDPESNSHVFQADLTCTFIARKVEFAHLGASKWLGEVEVMDIGAPREIYQRFNSSAETIV